MTEQAIEAEIQAKGLNAPRLKPSDIDAQIVGEAFHVFPGTTLTVCALTLKNGFQVTGESAAASLANFDQEIGRKIARENARQKIWAFEGYTLRNALPGEGSAFEENPMIKPTIGRVVWYYPAAGEGSREQPQAALVTYVHDDDLVNLTVFSRSGMPSGQSEVRLSQDASGPEDSDAPFCMWMPYQKQVAAQQTATASNSGKA